RYQQRGGKEQVVDNESALLREHGHEVTMFEEDNVSISDIPKSRLAIETVWSKKVISKIYRTFRLLSAHFDSDFPRFSAF
ncbi:MAG: hypothetical protein WBN48_15925, partial [Thiogranum sp.]